MRRPIGVISGKFHIGMGDNFDEKKGLELRAGGFGPAAAHMITTPGHPRTPKYTVKALLR
jgi:hypothetical protein